MRTLTVLLAVLALAGCASTERPATATVTLVGPGSGLESWTLERGENGPDRITVVLRSARDEALVVVLPRLKPGETDRVFRTGEFSAVFERPRKTAEAALDRGWVRATRRESGVEVELFLVLKPLSPASYESLQVITRVETPAR